MTLSERTEQPMSEEAEVTAEAFWQGRCTDCAHPEHEMTCHELVPNGDPSNGPAYCPCTVQIEWMEQEIVRLRSEREARGRMEAALKRLDAIARVDPRNAIGEVEFTDALAQSFTALHPNERPIWRNALTSTEGTSKAVMVDGDYDIGDNGAVIPSTTTPEAE